MGQGPISPSQNYVTSAKQVVSARISSIKLEQTEVSDMLIQFRPTSRLAMILWS